jgi:PAS domain S-box-containing protein
MDSLRAQGVRSEASESRSEPELQARVRAAAWLLVVSLAGFALAELIARPGENPAVSAVHAVALGILSLLLSLGYRSTSQPVLVFAALCGLLTAAATGAAVSMLTGDANSASFVFVALAMGSAALLPWGWRPQLVLGGILLPLFLVTVAVSEGHIGPLRFREFLGLVVMVGASVYIAYELERSRRALRWEGARRQEHERQVETQRRFLRQVIDTVPHLIFAKDREGRFTLVNEAVARVYGTTVQRLIGRTDADFNPKQEEVAFFREIDARVFETAQEHLVEEEKITDAAGRERWLRTIKRPLFGDDGSVVQVLGVATDITEERRFQRELEQEAHVAATLSAAAEEIIASLSKKDLPERLCATATQALGGKWGQLWLIDRERNEAHAAAEFNFSQELWQALQVLRVPVPLVRTVASRLIGREGILLMPEHAEEVLPAFLLPLTKNFHGALIVPLRRGEEVSGALVVGLLEDSFPLHPNQERIARGISQLASLAIENARVLEELEQASRLKSEFMATISHELRTPLNVIIGYASLIEEGVLGQITSDQSDAIARLHANALQLLEMVNSILDVTRLEGGRLPLDVRPVPLSEIVAAAVREARQQWREKEVDLWCLVPMHGPRIETDPAKLKVVVKNLVGNAIKFTPRGWVRVTAHCGDSRVRIAVEDTGVGIAPEEQAAIFEPFRQGRLNTAHAQSGVGLGLYIVRRLVEVMGGRIQVDSEPGRGATFVVELPVPPVSTRLEVSGGSR